MPLEGDYTSPAPVPSCSHHPRPSALLLQPADLGRLLGVGAAGGSGRAVPVGGCPVGCGEPRGHFLVEGTPRAQVLWQGEGTHLYRGFFVSGLSWKVESLKTTDSWTLQPTGNVSPTTAHCRENMGTKGSPARAELRAT